MQIYKIEHKNPNLKNIILYLTMSDSSDELVDIEIPYSKRPEWADVIPISQVGLSASINLYHIALIKASKSYHVLGWRNQRHMSNRIHRDI